MMSLLHDLPVSDIDRTNRQTKGKIAQNLFKCEKHLLNGTLSQASLW